MKTNQKAIFIFDLDDTLFDTTGQLDETYKNLPNINSFPDTIPTLKNINAIKILVSSGDRKIQEEKIRILKIKHYFTEIIICGTHEQKKEIFENIIKKYSTRPTDCWVIGDRINVEIRYGNMLGMNTVHMHHGKHKDIKPQDKFDKPMHTIKKLSELNTLCKQ
ncbi:MAG TPA: DUF705 domain-containing protein [Candidatus Nanoarchaeia archaeon]|nr:DUF705 domain-containing protein [Candidatus Nanoarchaeia archaeon]